jgi:hypothetical protein
VDGRAFVFSGHSGAGKTTTVRLLSPRPPLGDDLVALVPGPTGGFVARSLPFAGEYGVVAPLEAPLARIAFLEQAPVNEAIPLSESDARARILRNTLAYVRDRETAQRLQDVAGQLAGSTPAIRLRFQRDPSMADAAFGPISDGRG